MASRADVLARVRAALGEGEAVSETFCFECGAPGVAAIDDTSGETFVCAAGHRSGRAFLFDGRAVFSFDGDRLLHQTAGAVIQQGRGADRQTLLFLRRRFPLLYTLPAGHVEREAEPEAEMRREVLEETGLAVQASRRLWPGAAWEIADPCRRGADWHAWHVYQVEAIGQPRLSEEGRIIGWYTDAEVQELADHELLALPVRAILQRAGVVH